MMRFTPRLSEASDERIELDISLEDYSKVQRGWAWEAEVTDVQTGRTFVVAGAECGIAGCMCDAIVVREVKAQRH